MSRTPLRTGVSSLFSISLRPPVAAAPSTAAARNRPTQPHIGSRIISLMHRGVSRVMARAVAEDAYSNNDNLCDGASGSYFAHEFTVGAERAVEEFARRAVHGDVAAVACMASPFVVQDMERRMKAGGIGNQSSVGRTVFAVRHVRVGDPWVRYGCGGAGDSSVSARMSEQRVVKRFRDGSRLLASTANERSASRGSTNYVYEWHNLQWVFPRLAVIAAQHEIDDDFFTRHSGEAMRKGFVVGVDVFVDVDVADGENAARRRLAGLRVSFESGVHCARGADQWTPRRREHGQVAPAVANAREWRICDAADVVECLFPVKIMN
ncbi:hypothetical protein HDU83_006851 [Entophlyctis luteolus]|nr:hypothetical protein HDU82_007333 [Entophlyctis luteolus]KAJ3353366.1 hypothetical protein HDU83_006851 [Entophlyctis luteolus]